LVDDNSADGTKETINSYLNDYKHIVYTRNSERLGAGFSRNAGARMARGDILVFLDADIVIPQNANDLVKDYFSGSKVTPEPDAIVANRERECLCGDLVSMYKNYWTSYNFSKLKGWTSFLCSSFFAIKKDALFRYRRIQEYKACRG